MQSTEVMPKLTLYALRTPVQVPHVPDVQLFQKRPLYKESKARHVAHAVLARQVSQVVKIAANVVLQKYNTGALICLARSYMSQLLPNVLARTARPSVKKADHNAGRCLGCYMIKELLRRNIGDYRESFLQTKLLNKAVVLQLSQPCLLQVRLPVYSNHLRQCVLRKPSTWRFHSSDRFPLTLYGVGEWQTRSYAKIKLLVRKVDKGGFVTYPLAQRSPAY